MTTKLHQDLAHLRTIAQDVNKPSIAISEFTLIVATMLEENVAYIERNGRTEKAIQSQERLMKLMTIGETVSQIAGQNVAMKIECNNLLRRWQACYNELKQLKNEINLANSI